MYFAVLPSTGGGRFKGTQNFQILTLLLSIQFFVCTFIAADTVWMVEIAIATLGKKKKSRPPGSGGALAIFYEH